MSRSFVCRGANLLNNRDVVEGTERPINQPTLDHKLPQIRWSEETREDQTNYNEMSDEGIRQNFQLLKKSNGSVSHNLLKSRSCERCYKNGKRGIPFGINFFTKEMKSGAEKPRKMRKGALDAAGMILLHGVKT